MCDRLEMGMLLWSLVNGKLCFRRSVFVMAKKEKFQFEYLGVCTYAPQCGLPAVGKVWWQKDKSDVVFVCQTHLDELRGALEELREKDVLQSDLDCKKCAENGGKILVEVQGTRTKASCAECGAYIKWLGNADLNRYKTMSGQL